MSNEAKFIEKLNGLLKLAKDSDNQINIDEVKAYFSEDALTEEQMGLVFEYLMTQKVSVIGYMKLGQDAELELTEEEKLYLEEYEADLAAIKPEQPGEISVLVEKILQGDGAAKTRMVELYMHAVIGVAKELHQPDVFIGDLIQEGNLGLVIGIDLISNEENLHETMMGQVRQCMHLLLEEQSELASRDKKMVEKVQMLDEAITTLTEELGRKVSIEELAIHMGIEVSEVEDILKLAGEDSEEQEG